MGQQPKNEVLVIFYRLCQDCCVAWTEAVRLPSLKQIPIPSQHWIGGVKQYVSLVAGNGAEPIFLVERNFPMLSPLTKAAHSFSRKTKTGSEQWTCSWEAIVGPQDSSGSNPHERVLLKIRLDKTWVCSTKLHRMQLWVISERAFNWDSAWRPFLDETPKGTRLSASPCCGGCDTIMPGGRVRPWPSSRWRDLSQILLPIAHHISSQTCQPHCLTIKTLFCVVFANGKTGNLQTVICQIHFPASCRAQNMWTQFFGGSCYFDRLSPLSCSIAIAFAVVLEWWGDQTRHKKTTGLAINFPKCDRWNMNTSQENNSVKRWMKHRRTTMWDLQKKFVLLLGARGTNE